MLQVCFLFWVGFFCFSLDQTEDTFNLSTWWKGLVFWYYTWSVPPCSAELFSGDSVDTKIWPHSDWAGVSPGHTSVQLFASEAGSQEASHSLNSSLVQPMSLSQRHGAADWLPEWQQGCARRLQRAQWLLTAALEHLEATVAPRSPSGKWDRSCSLFVALLPTWATNPPLKLVVCHQSHGHCLHYSTVQINSQHCSQHYLKSFKDRRRFSRARRAWSVMQKHIAKAWRPERDCGIAFPGVQSWRDHSGHQLPCQHTIT